MLLDRQRVIGAALYRRVIDNDHAFTALDPTDAGDETGRGDLVPVHAPGRELADLEEGRTDIQQGSKALARQKLAASYMPGARFFRAAKGQKGRLVGHVGDERAHAFGIFAERGGGGRNL